MPVPKYIKGCSLANIAVASRLTAILNGHNSDKTDRLLGMSILKKKKFLIPAGVLLVLSGVAVAVFWPYFSAWQRYGAAQDEMREVATQAEAEFPEIADYAAFKKSLMPENNGWQDMQKALEMLQKIEKEEAAIDDELRLESESDEELPEFRDPRYYLDCPDKLDDAAFGRYVLKTAPILELLKKAATYETIVPPVVTDNRDAEDETRVSDVLEPFKLAFERSTMLQILGRNKQAEEEYYLGLKLASLLRCDNTFVGAMVHVGSKRVLSGYGTDFGKQETIEAQKAAIRYIEKESIDPAEILRCDLALTHRLISKFVNMSISEALKDWKQGAVFWDDEEETIAQRWTKIAEQSEAGVAIYRTNLEAATALRDKPIDYFDLNAIFDFLETVNRKMDSENVYIANTSELLAKYALLQPLALKTIEVSARLRLLKLESGPLNENRETVEALVKKHLPQFVVIWEKPAGDEDSSDWEEDMVLLVEPAAEFKAHAYLYDRLPNFSFFKEEKPETSEE